MLIRFIIGLLFISLLYGCKTSDWSTHSRIRSGMTDFFFSVDQYHDSGIKGFASVWDKSLRDYRVLPYTHSVSRELDSTYYQYHDWIYLGRGNIVSFNQRNKIIKTVLTDD